ncbi:hypothetical protein CY34DRAFT_375761 [Suillus luteus UH-Slu-Lm8-n1]|uniref:Unplaced genomic scaffold CY34scaffold_248, whole genome shotgun sequence n=1 Tax=Suillus luteus UH-Slu-Lm8-n1 TaxID=930992 RepID=A0A0D0B493_9AGAM|nr:hypothetical protein CY34DRAFT_375761 [Suillus luteus UH-Slu-Lm8-n1]
MIRGGNRGLTYHLQQVYVSEYPRPFNPLMPMDLLPRGSITNFTLTYCKIK